LKSKIRKK